MGNKTSLKLYFSDYFEVEKKVLQKYGAFDISLIADLPLFIDPFLLFQSNKPHYKALHSRIISYLDYLRDVSLPGTIDAGRLMSLFYFSEVKQNYLGFTSMGNSGRGLGKNFAQALNINLSKIFTSFGKETITLGTHLEKLCLISKGVGRDSISDFVTNLIKEYLLEYTQQFAKENINDKYKAEFAVRRVRFNRDLGVWTSGNYILPVYKNDFVILSPKDMLTRENTWISHTDYVGEFYSIVQATPNQQLQADLDSYFREALKKKYTWKEEEQAIEGFTRLHPEIIDYFIRSKENNGDKAVERSAIFVAESEKLFIEQFGYLVQFLLDNTEFYKIGYLTKIETYKRIMLFKDAIENKGCWTIFYNKDRPIIREEDVHVLFRLVWFGTELDVSREVNDGRGPADFKVSYGQRDKTLVEFKLAKNTHLKDNLLNQLEFYKKASDAESGYKVIIYFTDVELARVNTILRDLKMEHNKNIILVDARPKKSASIAR
jgi:hypothetical protein